MALTSMVDVFAWTTRSPIGHTHRRQENIWDTAVPQTETPTTVVIAVTIAMVVTPVPTIAMAAVIETVVVVSLALAAMTRIVTVILTAVIVVTVIAIGVGAHLLVVTHPTIVGAGAIPEALREAVALLGQQGTMMARPTAPAGKFALCHHLSM